MEKVDLGSIEMVISLSFEPKGLPKTFSKQKERERRTPRYDTGSIFISLRERRASTRRNRRLRSSRLFQFRLATRTECETRSEPAAA